MHSCGLVHSGSVSVFFIMLISVCHTKWASNVLLGSVFEHHFSRKLLLSHNCVSPACGVRAKTGRGGEGRDIEMCVEVLHQYRWWVYASTLPRGPAAMTSHPSPYALIHFTFIRTSNDFPAMKVKEGNNKTLVGEKWNLHPAMAIGPAFRNCCKGQI